MAGRRTTRLPPTTFAQTPGVDDPKVQRAVDVLTGAVQELQAKVEHDVFTSDVRGIVPASGGSASDFLAADGEWKSLTGAGLVDSVTAGSSAITATPTVGAVVIDVVEANFSGIPMAAVTFSGTNNRLAKFSGTTLADSTITDTGVLVTVANPMTVTGAGIFNSTVNVVGDFSVNTNKFTVAASSGNTLVAGTLTVSPMTAGSVLFAGAAGLVSQDNAGFFWDDTNNKLGVGTSSFSDNTGFSGSTVPTLEVQAPSGSAQVGASAFSATASDAGHFVGIRGRGSRSVPSVVTNGDRLAVFSGSGYSAATVNRFATGGQMQVVASGTWTTTSFPARLEFYTVPSAGTTPLLRATIFDDGAVNIGSTTTNPSHNLRVEGNCNVTTYLGVGKAANAGNVVVDALKSGSAQLRISSSSAAGAYTGYVINANTTTEKWYIGLDGTGATDGLIFRRGGATDDMKLDASGNFSIATTKFTVAASSGNTTVAGTLGVTGLATLTAGFSLGADSSAASHKITNLTNGSSAQDAAAFGQIATAVNAAVSGTTNTIAMFTAANVVGNSPVTDSGTVTTVTARQLSVTGISGNHVIQTDNTTTGQTIGHAGIRNRTRGSYDTTAGAITTYGIQNSNSSTRSAGASDLTSVAGYFDASGAQVNVALQTASGSNYFNTTSGSTGLGYALGATLPSTLSVTGSGTFTTTLDVTGNFNVNTNKFSVVAASGNTTVAGTLGVTGDVAVNTNKFTVAASSGDTVVAGTLGVTGAATLSSTLAVNGNCTLGDADGDTHTVRGTPTVQNTGANSTSRVYLTNDAQTWDIACRGDASDKFVIRDTTAATEPFTIEASTGAVAVTGALTVTGNCTLTDAAGDTLKFHGGTGATQQTITGSRGGNAALADLLTKLATLGLIVDGTTA